MEDAVPAPQWSDCPLSNWAIRADLLRGTRFSVLRRVVLPDVDGTREAEGKLDVAALLDVTDRLGCCSLPRRRCELLGI